MVLENVNQFFASSGGGGAGPSILLPRYRNRRMTFNLLSRDGSNYAYEEGLDLYYQKLFPERRIPLNLQSASYDYVGTSNLTLRNTELNLRSFEIGVGNLLTIEGLVIIRAQNSITINGTGVEDVTVNNHLPKYTGTGSPGVDISLGADGSFFPDWGVTGVPGTGGFGGGFSGANGGDVNGATTPHHRLPGVSSGSCLILIANEINIAGNITFTGAVGQDGTGLTGPAGGGHGGYLFCFAHLAINHTSGSINTSGGNGGAGTTGNTGGAGGGLAGGQYYHAPAINLTGGTRLASNGTGGAKTGTGIAGTSGTPIWPFFGVTTSAVVDVIAPIA
jgi:hypothetical protein